MGDLRADLRFAFRALIRSPWFTALAVVTLAIGIGGTTALFSLVDTVVLRPLPFKDPHRLVEIWGEDATRGGMRVPAPILEALVARAPTLAAIAVHSPAGAVLRTPDGPLDVRGQRVSANFIDVMGIPPFAGRGFLPEDERPGAPAVVVLRFGFWQQQLGGDPEVIGRTLYFDALPFTVVGIMPPEFKTKFRGLPTDYWSPYVSDRERVREEEAGFELVARLAPGASVEQARREAQAVAAGVNHAGWAKTGRRLGLVPLKREVVGDSGYALQLLFAAVAVVLLIVCANLAQLLLARADRRLIEFATRKAVGASAAQLFRLSLAESLMLSAAGGAAGVALAYWLLPALITLAPEDIPRLADAAIDTRVLATAVVLTAATGCLFGLAPALRLSRLPVVQAMKRPAGGATPRSTHVRAALVVAQVAASVTLVALAGLVGRTFLTLLPSAPGFEAGSRTVFLLFMPSGPYPDASDRVRRLEELAGRLEAAPGIVEAGFASNVPFSGDQFATPVRMSDSPTRLDDAPRSDVREISPNVFRLLQMPLVEGRAFTANDRIGSPRVAIVNQRLARGLRAEGGVLGRTIRIGRSAEAPLYQIVGIVADARSTGESSEPLNEVYIPFAQSGQQFAYVIVRSARPSAELTAVIRREVRAVAPELPLRSDQRAEPMADLLQSALAGPRFSATLIGAFCATAFLLAVIGVFGLVAFSVSERRQELGIRAALGAGPAALLSTVMRAAMILAVAGTVVGLAAAAYLTRFVESRLYGIEPLDVPTFAAAAAVMVVAAGLAAYLPARRAVRADPMLALRYE